MLLLNVCLNPKWLALDSALWAPPAHTCPQCSPGLAALLHASVQNDHCPPTGCRPHPGCSSHLVSVFSAAVPKCFPADSHKVRRAREESELPVSSACWNTRKSEKAFRYSQQVSAPRYVNTSNKGM